MDSEINGRVASLDASAFDAPFRTCVASGAGILAGLSILVCTPSPFDPERFRHLWMTVRFLSGLGCRRVKTIVLTDAVEASHLQQLEQLVKPISDETVIRPERDLNSLKDLPWRHKKIIWEEFLNDDSPFDLFIYLEDDIFLTSENIAYFIACRQALDQIGFIPSFIRCEYNLAQHRVYSIDQVAPQWVVPNRKIQIGQATFVNSDFPFCAMYIFDRALAREHLGTRSASQELSASVGGWGEIEHASLGQIYENVQSGFSCRYLVPVDPDTLQPLPSCIVHHSSDKYTNLDVIYGRVPLDGVFASEPKNCIMIEPPPLEELLLNFESLGDNCEFGLVQRQAGLEPLGLLRFSFTPMQSLLRALDCEFADVSDLNQIEVRVATNKELIVTVLGYEFVYHSQRQEGEIEAEELRRQEALKLKYLTRRLVGSLREGDKIFIRKGEGSGTLDEAKTLHAAMQKYGAPALLWITQADETHPAGSVELVEPGLLWGRIDQFSPYDRAPDTSFTMWIDICLGAYRLWKSGAPAGRILEAAIRNNQQTNLLFSISPEEEQADLPRIILQTHNVKNTPVLGPFPHRTYATPTLCKAVLADDGIGMLGVRVSGLVPDQLYTFSLWIKLEVDADLTQAWLVFPDRAMVRSRSIRSEERNSWQRLEATASAPSDGAMFPRINVVGTSGSAFYTANWRLEPGPMVDMAEYPGRPFPLPTE